MTDIVSITSAKCDNLRFVTMMAKECLGQLFDFQVQFESEDQAIDLTGLLGSSMTVKLTTENGFVRHFNGMVVSATQTGVDYVEDLVYAQYEVKLAPKPWLLMHKVDCRIYKQMSAPDIIKQVLGEIGYSDVRLSLSGTYATRDYCVQYREDYFNFISRLMEQEGIYYYFTHTDSTHTMVLADGIGGHEKVAGFSDVAYSSTSDSVLRRQATITSWAAHRTADVAKYVFTDYDPMAPKASLLCTGTSDGHGDGDEGANGKLDIFDYPGLYTKPDVGNHYARVRAEALSASLSRYSGSTGECQVQIGGLFKLSDYPRDELNREYLIVESEINLHAPSSSAGNDGGELMFHCGFYAIESSLTYHSMQTARKPTIVGLQTAVVTGSKTEEDIAVDQYGRVEVTFHWNTPDKKNAKCSCPVRVATPWAGKNWGAISIPRVGQEVVVSFLEGDPDRPLIIGSVYNGDNQVPYSLPDNKTQSGIKSRSLLGGTADFNELRFEDKKGSEDFFMHAQKDMHEEVENDHVVTIDHDETVTIKHDRKATISNNDTIDVGQVFKLTAGTQIELTTGSSSIVMKSSGEIQITGVNITITGNSSVKVEGQMQVGIKAGMAMDVGAGVSMKVHSDGTLDVKGTMVSAGGDAMTKVGGGIIMIG